MSNDLAEDYVLGADIDLTSFSWTTVGSEGSPFTGSLDGAGYTISNLTLNATTTRQGIFGWTNGVSVHDLIIDGFNLHSTQQFIACLIAQSEGTTVDRVLVRNTSVEGEAGYASLLVARPTNTTVITNCGVIGSLTGTFSNDGGLVGGMDTSSILDKSYAVIVRQSCRPVSGGSSGTVTNTVFDSTVAGSSADGNSGSIARTTAQMQDIDTYTDEGGVITNAWDMVLEENFNPSTPSTWFIAPNSYPQLGFEFEIGDLTPAVIAELSKTANQAVIEIASFDPSADIHDLYRHTASMEGNPVLNGTLIGADIDPTQNFTDTDVLTGNTYFYQLRSRRLTE